MSAPTPTHTPTPTPISAPIQSPVRVLKEDRTTKNGTEPSKKREKKEDYPRVTLITNKGSNFPEKEMSHTALLNYVKKTKILKYIYPSIVDPALIGYLYVRRLVSCILGTWRHCGVVDNVSYVQGPAQPLVIIHHPHVSTA